MLRSKLFPVLLSIIPFVVFLLHVKIFGSYIIDDAGILFSYARNIANGFGIVSQPGVSPVEGCSDFLWVILFVPFFWLNIFDPVITTKIFSVFIILVLYLFVSFKFKKELPGVLLFLFLLFLSITTPFAIWNSSGLENPLYVLLICILFYTSYKILTQSDLKLFVMAGSIAFLIAITRPDGVLYFFCPPFLIVLSYVLNKKYQNIPWKKLFIYSLIFGVSFGAFLLFRFLYFGELVPNTYYFKGGPKLKDIINIVLLKEEIILKLQNLFSSVVNKQAFLCIALMLILNCWIFFTRLFNLFHLCITIFFIFTCLNYLLLPYDWMSEFRFATPFIFFFFLFLISSLFIALKKSKFQLQLTLIGLVILMFSMGNTFYSRSNYFAQHPTVPFQYVTENIAVKFNDYADKLGLKDASLLTPDCGGTLFYSKLKVYDLAGLIDKRYALVTLGKNNDALYNLVFEEDKPTFIEIHSDWAYHTNLQSDPRFYRDYVPIEEHEDWLYSRNIKSGHYIRKDVLKYDSTRLEKISNFGKK